MLADSTNAQACHTLVFIIKKIQWDELGDQDRHTYTPMYQMPGGRLLSGSGAQLSALMTQRGGDGGVGW